MEFFKKHIVFFVLVALGVIAFFAFGYLYFSNLSKLESAKTKVTESRGALRQLLGRDMASTEANRQSMENYLQQLEDSFQRIRGEILRTDLTEKLFSEVPETPQRFTFTHLAFREEMKRMATSEDYSIELSPAVDHFSFDRYPGTPPPQNLIAPLYRQREIIRFVLSGLFEARPNALLSVKRGAVPGETAAPAAAVTRGRGQAATSSSDPEAGLFTIRPDISARVPGVVDTVPVQVVFIGRTVALRSFLNNLAESDLPIVVRNVEVKSLAQRRENRPTRGRGGDSESAAPAATARGVPAGFSVVISENLSEFTVTLEFLVPAS